MKTTIFVLLLLIGVMLPQRVMALFANIPLPDVVKGSSIVLVGKIEKIEENKYTSSNNLALTYDVALIRVKEILKNNQDNVSIIAGQTIPLSMPSKGMERIYSRAINFDLNQEGIWILDYKNGYFEATYPKDFQPLSETENIQKMIREEKIIAAPRSCSSSHHCSSNIVLSALITNSSFRLKDRIEVTVTYNNRGDVPVDIDEGSLRAEFADKTQNDMFWQAVRASYASGVKTISLKPGEEYKDILILEPNRNAREGKFRAKISSTFCHGSKKAIEAGEVVFEMK